MREASFSPLSNMFYILNRGILETKIELAIWKWTLNLNKLFSIVGQDMRYVSLCELRENRASEKEALVFILASSHDATSFC